jgi:hypothetical protein
MALVEKYIVVAAVQDLDPASGTIKEGMIVTLTNAGVKLPTLASQAIYGIAGDTFSTTASAMPGVKTGWQNRASDGYDETKSSGKITVYNSGGEFGTDQHDNTNLGASYVGQFLKSKGDGRLMLDGATRTLDSVAQLTRAAGYYPSGVPGTNINGDTALGGDNGNYYIEIKLLV